MIVTILAIMVTLSLTNLVFIVLAIGFVLAFLYLNNDTGGNWYHTDKFRCWLLLLIIYLIVAAHIYIW